MKQAKRILSVLLAVTMALSLVTCSAGAATAPSDRETTAQVLSALGLFKGYDNTGTNFGLHDAASREQALIFLIRILGEEKAAEAWTGAQPYSDVTRNHYFYPYVGYAKEKGYTKGIGNNQFGCGQNASMAQMATFALRGLGYSEAAGDFAYATSVSFAVSLGILDTATSPATFTRGDALDILDGAVAAKVKNQRYTLLEKLISSGAVTQAQVEKAAALAGGPAQGKSDIAPGTYTLQCMGNSLRITSDKLELRNTSPAQRFTITRQDGYSYIQTAEGDYIGVTSVEKGTQPVLGTTPYAWLIQKVSTGVYTIRPAEKPEMLACSGEASGKNGTQLLLWPHTDNAKHGLITFTAATKKVAVTGIKLDQTSATLVEGKSLQLTGAILPSNATNRDVIWSSSASTIATVSGDGRVTAVKAGTATITAKTADGSKTATCKVTVTASSKTYVDKTVHLYNSANQAATDIRISVCADNDWGQNLISAPLQPNASVELIVPVSGIDYLYDMTILYADGSTATFNGYNFKKFTSGAFLYAYISSIGTLKLSVTKPAPPTYTDKTLHLYNSTDQAATDIRISSTQNRDWGKNLISTPVQPTAKVDIDIPVSSTDYTYDIAIVYADGSTATFAGYNFKSFTTGGSLYAYISSGTPMLSTTKPASADTTAASAALLKRYNAVVTRFNATQGKLEQVGLYIDPLKASWDSAAAQLNTELKFMSAGSVYTGKQISTANAILDEVDLMLKETQGLIEEAIKLTSRTVVVSITNKMHMDIANLGCAPSSATAAPELTSFPLQQGATGTLQVTYAPDSPVLNLVVRDKTGLTAQANAASFLNIDFTNCPATGGTITLVAEQTGKNPTVTTSWK